MRAGAVLIVEDAETCATTLDVAFSAIPDLAVVLAASAPDAIRMLKDEHLSVRAVVTDLNLPGMDGFELIRLIRAGARHSRVPVIVVSGETDPRAPERARSAGADAFFSKPFSPAQVRQKLEQLLDANR